MFADIHDLLDGVITDLVWIGYRESAKTWIAKCFKIYCIVYRLIDYGNVDSYDDDNSEAFLYDVIIELQTNKKLIEDFGNLYNSPRSKDENTKKRIGDFMVNPVRDDNGQVVRLPIRVEGHSTQTPVRGRQHNGKRPDLLIMDDFENNITIKSEKITTKVWDHIKEFKGGLDSLKGKKLYLCNYISKFANVQKLIDMAEVNHKMRVRIFPIIRDGEITWKEKYVWTDKDAEEYKLQNPTKSPKISIEAKKRDMWDPNTGDMTWEGEMMCNPIDNSLAKFKQEHFKNISLEEVLRRKLPCFVLIDPAVSEKDESDDTGVAIIWTDQENLWYSKVFKLRLDSVGLQNFFFEIYAELAALGTPARRIGVEEEKYYKAIYPFLKVEMAKRSIYLPMMPLKPAARSKEDRITNALQYRYEAGHIFHVVGEMLGGRIPMLNTEYETQAQRFPGALHDDMLDAHAYGADIVRFDMEESEQEKQKKEIARKDPYDLEAFVKKGIEERKGSQYVSPYDDDDEDDYDPVR
jgi:hypothetical protein